MRGEAREGRRPERPASGAMAPMGIRLSPLGVAVFCLLGLGVLYHLYSGFLAGRFSLFGLGGEPGGGPAGPVAAADGGTVDLREMLAVSVLAAVRGGDEVRRVRESNVLHEKSKGKTREGADDKMTSGDVLSNRKMFYLLKTAFPNVQVGAASAWRRGSGGPSRSGGAWERAPSRRRLPTAPGRGAPAPISQMWMEIGTLSCRRPRSHRQLLEELGEIAGCARARALWPLPECACVRVRHGAWDPGALGGGWAFTSKG